MNKYQAANKAAYIPGKVAETKVTASCAALGQDILVTYRVLATI